MTDTATHLRRYVVVRVEFPEGTTDRNAGKLADELVVFGCALGLTTIVDEGIGESETTR